MTTYLFLMENDRKLPSNTRLISLQLAAEMRKLLSFLYLSAKRLNNSQ